MTNQTIILRTIRTGVPALVGALLAFLTAQIPVVGDAIVWLNDNAHADVAGVVTQVATALVIVVYYALVSWLAKRWTWLEGFLGSTKTPVEYVSRKSS